MAHESFRTRTFLVTDPDSRLRDPDALHKFLVGTDGQPLRIPAGTKISVDDVRRQPQGGKRVALFVRALPVGGGDPLGWTSANNLDGRFLSETLGRIPPAPGAGKHGPNAAWANGSYLGQIVLIEVSGTDKEIEHIAEQTAEPFLAMVAAAREDGVLIGLNSGFRSWHAQKHLHDGWVRRLPNFNPANRPGNSNHQNGIAFDIDVGGGGGNATYAWLQRNATKFGFVRTVRREAWHWEYLPEKAAAARRAGRCTVWA
jgi:hypothetical protein